MARVRQQSKRVREDAGENLNNDISEIQGRADSERFSEILRHLRMIVRSAHASLLRERCPAATPNFQNSDYVRSLW